MGKFDKCSTKLHILYFFPNWFNKFKNKKKPSCKNFYLFHHPLILPDSFTMKQGACSK